MRTTTLTALLVVVFWPLLAQGQDLGDIDPYGGPEQFIETEREKTKPEPTAKKTEEATQPAKERPKLRRIEPDKSALEFMRGVCGDDARMVDDKDDSTGRVTHVPQCSFCPEGSSDPSGSLQLEAGFVGDFSGDGRAEALLSTRGCSDWFHGSESTVLLRNESVGWKTLEYFDSGGRKGCTPVKGGAHDILLCELTESGQGSVLTTTFASHVQDDGLAATTLLETHDHANACHYTDEFRRSVEARVIDDLDDDGNVEIAFGIRSTHGKPKTDVSSVEARCEEANYELRESTRLVVWELGPDGLAKDASAARKTDHPKLAPFKGSGKVEK